MWMFFLCAWTVSFFLTYMRIMRIICICRYKRIHVDIRIIRNRMAHPNANPVLKVQKTNPAHLRGVQKSWHNMWPAPHRLLGTHKCKIASVLWKRYLDWQANHNLFLRLFIIFSLFWFVLPQMKPHMILVADATDGSHSLSRCDNCLK